MSRIPLVLVVGVLVLPCAASGGEQADCVYTFYRAATPACIDEVIDALPASIEHGKASMPQDAIGFLAKIFGSYPEEKQRILARDAPPSTREVLIEALYRAKLPEEAKEYAKKIGKVDLPARPPLDIVRPFAEASDNDLLIGAYMASGDIAYIRTILDNFTTADDAMAAISFRMGLMTGKFGFGMGPAGREHTMMRAACQKYECKKDAGDFMRITTLASAFWALTSLGKRDEEIKATTSDFFEGNLRLKKLLAIEQTSFSNYMAALITYVTTGNEKFAEALSIYENLGSAGDCLQALNRAWAPRRGIQ